MAFLPHNRSQRSKEEQQAAQAAARYQQQINALREQLNRFQEQQQQALQQQQNQLQQQFNQKLQTQQSQYQQSVQAAQNRYNQLLQQSQNAQKQYKENITAAQQRFSDLSAQYQQQEQALTARLSGLGAAEEENLQQQRKVAEERWKQAAINQGIFGTTQYDRGARDIQSASAEQLSALQQRLRNEALQYKTNLSGQTLSAQKAYADVLQQSATQGFNVGKVPVGVREEIARMLAEQQNLQQNARLGFQQISGNEALQLAKLRQQSEAFGQNYSTQLMQSGAQQGLSYAQLAQGQTLAEQKARLSAYQPSFSGITRWDPITGGITADAVPSGFEHKGGKNYRRRSLG